MNRSWPGSATILVASVALSAFCLASGGLLTSIGMEGGWYEKLARPSWQPPGWAFSVAWTTIFALKAIALWILAKPRPDFDRRRVESAVLVYFTQIVLNVAWSAIFFASQSPAAALVEIIALDVLVVLTMVQFARISRVAAALLAPYALWLVLATALNAWIVAHN